MRVQSSISRSILMFGGLGGLSALLWLGGCLPQNSKVGSSGSSSALSPEEELEMVACFSQNDSSYSYYTSLTSCQTAWASSPTACANVVVTYLDRTFVCARHPLDMTGATTGASGATTGSTTSGTTTGSTTSGTTTGSTTSAVPPDFAWASPGHDFGYVNSYDSASLSKTVSLTLQNNGGPATGCTLSMIGSTGFTIIGSCSSIPAGGSCSISVKTALPSPGAELTGGLRIQCSGGVQYDTSANFLKAKGSYSTVLGFYSIYISGGLCASQGTYTSKRVYYSAAIDWSNAYGTIVPLHTNGSLTSLLGAGSAYTAAKIVKSGGSFMWLNQWDGHLVQECRVGDPI